ncbi:MAG: pyridoxine 5'-phosphate synthase [Pseudomonadota bacterium]
MTPLALSVNIDHVATLRNARGGAHPCPVKAAKLAMNAGANGITIHLREDRRHIRDNDLQRVAAEVEGRLNFEMAATEEMIAMALSLRPPACCIVPEKRAELTTEGGLDIIASGAPLRDAVARLAGAGIEVAIFVEADAAQIEAARAIGAQAIELHTGAFAEDPTAAHLARLAEGARLGAAAGLIVHAGHGLSYETLPPVAAFPELSEVSIGHFLIGQSIFEGLPNVIARFKSIIRQARAA